MKTPDERLRTVIRQLSPRDHAFYLYILQLARVMPQKTAKPGLDPTALPGHVPCCCVALKTQGEEETCTQERAHDKRQGPAGAPNESCRQERCAKETKGLYPCCPLSAQHPLPLICHVKSCAALETWFRRH